MPVLVQAYNCLKSSALQVPTPPARFHIRPGATFSASADDHTDECCEGVAWVRGGLLYETDAFPTQRSDAGVDQPAYYALQVELGIVRCLPTQGPDGGGSILDEVQWRAAAQATEDDRWALRTAVCCLRNVYGVDAVIPGSYAPLESEGNCSGITVLVTVRLPACDC
jgi:hypothetical protein